MRRVFAGALPLTEARDIDERKHVRDLTSLERLDLADVRAYQTRRMRPREVVHFDAIEAAKVRLVIPRRAQRQVDRARGQLLQQANASL